MSPIIQDEDVKFGKHTQDSVVKTLSWRDVLYSRHLPYNFSLSEFAGTASYLGYEYILWNDIIFTKEDGVWMRTHMTIQNVK